MATQRQAPKNVVASVLARLRNVAQDAGLSFSDILQSYAIERFLARLAQSPHVDTVLLKGALMLRVRGVPRARPTMDIDLLRRGVADQADLVRLVEQCAAIGDPSDGVTSSRRRSRWSRFATRPSMSVLAFVNKDRSITGTLAMVSAAHATASGRGESDREPDGSRPQLTTRPHLLAKRMSLVIPNFWASSKPFFSM
jgi:hypothetical protein